MIQSYSQLDMHLLSDDIEGFYFYRLLCVSDRSHCLEASEKKKTQLFVSADSSQMLRSADLELAAFQLQGGGFLWDHRRNLTLTNEKKM